MRAYAPDIAVSARLGLEAAQSKQEQPPWPPDSEGALDGLSLSLSLSPNLSLSLSLSLSFSLSLSLSRPQ